MRVPGSYRSLLLAFVIGLALSLLLDGSFALAPLLITLVGRTIHGEPLPGVPLLDCTHDPAEVPPAPLNSDGSPANYLHTCGSRLYDSHGVEVRLTGVNWSGMENSGYAPGGLGTRNWQEILDQIAALGYNAIRLPFTNEAIESSQPIGNVNFALNPDLQGLTGLEVLDRIVDGAHRRGLKVILDRHQPTSDNRTDLWYSSEVSEEQWVADWRLLAKRYRGNDAVVAMDLANEPHGSATWGTSDPNTDWHLAAERAGAAVLQENPYVLVMVEGVENVGDDHFWWGGNLLGVETAPVALPISNRVIYSPHDYGPAISAQPWFSYPSFPANLSREWDRHWGYIAQENIAPIVVGEFGGWSFGNDLDGLWQTTLIRYLVTNQFSAFVWSLNPSWDTGGILNDDWTTVNQVKQQAYRPILAPPIDHGPTGVFGRAPTVPHVAAFVQNNGSTSDVNVTFRIFDDGPTALDLGLVEVRYWLDDPGLTASSTRLNVTTEGISSDEVTADVLSEGNRSYVRIRFSPASEEIAPYRSAGSVTVQLQHAVTETAPAATIGATRPSSTASAAANSAGSITTYLGGKPVETSRPFVIGT